MAVLDGKKEQLEDAERYTFAKIKERIIDAWGTILFTIVWIIFLACGAALLWPELDWRGTNTLPHFLFPPQTQKRSPNKQTK